MRKRRPKIFALLLNARRDRNATVVFLLLLISMIQQTHDVRAAHLLRNTAMVTARNRHIYGHLGFMRVSMCPVLAGENEEVVRQLSYTVLHCLTLSYTVLHCLTMS